MVRLPFIDIDGKRYLWSEILERRRMQRAAHEEVQQLALFELKHDCRPPLARTAGGRYTEPSLFDAAGEAASRPP